jgi:hypothetical protein
LRDHPRLAVAVRPHGGTMMVARCYSFGQALSNCFKLADGCGNRADNVNNDAIGRQQPRLRLAFDWPVA